MVKVIINNIQHLVPEEVYEWMKQSRIVIQKTRKVREVQKLYFKNHDRDILAQSKVLEKELDNLLDGKTAQQEGLQAELFR